MNFIEKETAQKLRGGYYTPLDLAVFLARWVKEIKPKHILEPSCGDGIFFEAFDKVKGFRQSHILGFELEPDEAAKAKKLVKYLGLKNANIRKEDFLHWAVSNLHSDEIKFDAIVGNPPFVRYQYLPAPFQVHAQKIFEKLNLHFTKHTNAWVSFILASISLLRPGGRLAMVVPAEIIHVTHAQSLRTYLGNECRRLVIIDPEELWFDNTLQGVVILMAEKKHSKKDNAEGLGMYPVKGRDFTRANPSDIFHAPQAINGKTVEGKWTRALLDPETLSLFDELEEYKSVQRFEDVAQVDVGIVTGANKFFLVPDEIVESYNLDKWAYPMFGRSEHCPGVIYDKKQHTANSKKGIPTNFLWFQENNLKLNKKAKEYIKDGEKEGLHTRYKCRIRSPWYKVPSVYSTKIGMLKRSHDTPRLILNRIGAYTTDTAYRIQAFGVSAEQLVGCFINPLTALSAEFESRHYGGGVLELIPSEIERLIIPLPKKAKIDLVSLDKAIRKMPTEQVLKTQGNIVLGALGVSKSKQERLLEGWRKLRNRRHRVSS